ncbi:Cytochrome P450 [Melia azedarach]|uniref:Dihydroniloticin synthase CYP71CD2 n=2 Tax=Melia azedarach TaxID=155640 RepID=C1CD2_MELAZ|nr:Cytochrome P450 [Melia azedarach]QDZ36314.1 CYP71CD2 [Melia azedarach]
MNLQLDYFSITSFLVFLVVLFRIVSDWNKKSTNLRLPPGPSKLPIIGSVHHMIGLDVDLPYHALTDLAKKYGPLMHLQLGQMSLVVASSAKMFKELMKENDLAISQRPVPYVARVLNDAGRDIAFVPYGDYWRQIRKISRMELFSVRKVQSLYYIREDQSNKMIDAIGGSAETVMNLSKAVSDYTSTVVARAAFGSGCKDQDKFIKLSLEMVAAAGAVSTLPDMFPALGFIPVLSGKKAFLQNIQKEADKILDYIIDEHIQRTKSKDYDGKESDKEDIVDVLLRLEKTGELEIPITTPDIKAVIWSVFAGGTDTSSTTTLWAMSELMRNPKVMEKVQAEVREKLKGKKEILEADIQDLPYMRAVIKETLRLRIPGPLLLPRETMEPIEVDGYVIPEKTKILFNAWAVTRDPELWENPESFIPERFIEKQIDFKGTNYEFTPFGSGRRICPGMNFGIANVELPLAKLLYYFNWQLPHGMKPEDLDMTAKFGVVCGRKNDLFLIPTPYNIEVEN